MNLTLTPLIVLWGVLAASVLVLIVWRKMVDRNEDDTLQLLHAEAVSTQAAVAQKLEVIDRWGKGLTILTAVLGVLIGGLFAYQTWVQTTTTILR
jgi:hypothetical protein